MKPIHTGNAAHYAWGQGCDGWRLADGEDLSVIEETMPPGTGETPHHHARARQFFYVLAGEASMELGRETHVIGPGWGIEVPPETVHRIRNGGADPVRFLVISSPGTRGDRVEAATENPARH